MLDYVADIGYNGRAVKDRILGAPPKSNRISRILLFIGRTRRITQYSAVGGMRTYSAVVVIVVLLTLFELWLNLILLITFIRRTTLCGLDGPPKKK